MVFLSKKSIGGKMLAPLFRKQIFWRILDSLVCLTIWAIAVTMVMHSVFN